MLGNDMPRLVKTDHSSDTLLELAPFRFTAKDPAPRTMSVCGLLVNIIFALSSSR